MCIPQQEQDVSCSPPLLHLNQPSALADVLLSEGQLSPSETTQAFFFNFEQIKRLCKLPDLRNSKATQELWQKSSPQVYTIFRLSSVLCTWGSQEGMDRRLVQIMAARIQVGTPLLSRSVQVGEGMVFMKTSEATESQPQKPCIESAGRSVHACARELQASSET